MPVKLYSAFSSVLFYENADVEKSFVRSLGI